MKRIAFVLVVTLLAVTTSFFGVVSSANAATEYYNLSIPERPSSPYDKLENYDKGLTQTGTDPEKYPVAMTRHHIIPDNKLQLFWNTMLDNNGKYELVKAGDQLLRAIQDNVYKYNMPQLDKFKPGSQSPREQVKSLVSKIRYGEYMHDPTKSRPDGFDNLSSVYEWLPGNLFIGPQGGNGKYQRSDDPGSDFEKNSNVIIGSKSYDYENKACQAIKNYLNNGSWEDAQTASKKLMETAKKSSPYAVKADNWLLGRDTRYEIKQTQTPSDPCKF